jgi:hypothetical protein
MIFPRNREDMELGKPAVDLRLVSRLELGLGAVAMRYEPRRQPVG